MDKIKKITIICVIVLIAVVGVVIGFNYKMYHPDVILQGNNKYTIGTYDLEKSGLKFAEELIKKTENIPDRYDISKFSAELNKAGKIKSFVLVLNTYDENGKYKDAVSYDYSNKNLEYSHLDTYSDKILVDYNSNSSIEFIDKCIKSVPLKKQLKVSELKRYFIDYQPYTQIAENTPIFDQSLSTSFPVLSKQEYNQKKGGVSDGKTSVVLRLYEGKSLIEGQQYLYVFKPANAKQSVGNQMSVMECDYYINNGSLKFTKDYGQKWFDTDITKDELNETLKFYRNGTVIPPQCIFISADDNLPVAYFYAANPRLKILTPSANAWTDVAFPTADDFGNTITKRAVGFVDADFGYAALGTDWSMGQGESKACYFTSDGGKTWTEKKLPEQGTDHTLIDMSMINNREGVITLKSGIDGNFPIVYVTNDCADSWKNVDIDYDSLPEDIQYLTDIKDFSFSDGIYKLILGQSDDSVNVCIFTSDNILSPFKFEKTDKMTVHLVG